LSQKYFGKKNYLSLIGFSFDYSKSYDLIKNRYSNIPSQFFLKNNSDIFFDKTAWSSYSSNFIKSKESDIHQVFVLMGDPATHLLIQRLYNKLNDHIKFIVGITSEVVYQKTNQEEISIEHLKIGANPNLKAFISKSTDSRGLIKFYQNAIKLDSQEQIYKAMTDEYRLEIGNPLYLLAKHGEGIGDATITHYENFQPLKLDYQFRDGAYNIPLESSLSGYVFLPIPFVKNWKAYLDNVEVDILPANYAFMAVKINSGAHNLTLKIDRSMYYIFRNLSWALSLFLLMLIIRNRRLLISKPIV
jgi:hypothetical protein